MSALSASAASASALERVLGAVITIAAICAVMASVLVFLQPETTTAEVRSERADSLQPSMLTEVVASEACDSHCRLSRDDLTNSICASDGKIYLNACFFANAQCKNASLTRVTDWNGDSCPNSCAKPISCQEIGIYLCGSDGNVYFGYCSLFSAQCIDPSIQRVECPAGLFIRRSGGQR